jgi:nucleotide-binding universal stress UspA family protein
MYERVLVPLDGSERAETILPLIQQMAGPLDAELILLRVVEPISTAEAIASAGIVSPDSFALRELEAKQYLDGVERRLSKKGLRAHTRVAFGEPPEVILTVAKETGADLIAIATRARTALGRLVFGSVAETVLRASPVPVLMIRMTTPHEVRPDRLA